MRYFYSINILTLMQQIQRVNLKALKRCDQVWEEMQPIKGGRLCELCNNKITDFRQKSLKEIAEAHVFSDKPVCGLYTDNQLNNVENEIEIESVPWWNSIKTGYLSLASFLLTLTTSGQDSNVVDSIKTEQEVIPTKSKEKPTDLNEEKRYLLRGFISDETKNKLEYANIVLLNNDKVISGVSSDKNGYFELNITKGLDEFNDNFKLGVSYIGYPKMIVQIDKSKFILSNKYNNLFIHQFNHQMMSEGTVVKKDDIRVISFGIISKPELQKPKIEKKKSWLSSFWNSIKSIFTKNDKK